MKSIKITVERFDLVSSKSFEEILLALDKGIGRPLGALRRDPVLGENRCQVRYQAIFAERREHDDAGQNPKRPTAKCSSDSYPASR